MDTNTPSSTWSTVVPLRGRDRSLLDAGPVGPDHGWWPPVPTTRGELMLVVDEFAETPAGRQALHGWHQHEILADALLVIAGDHRADPLRLAARDLAGAFGTTLLGEVRVGLDDLVELPDLIAAFVPYAHALRGTAAAETAAALAVVAHCRRDFVGSLSDDAEVGGLAPWPRRVDSWQPPPPPSEWELLVAEVGDEEALLGLSTEPLPDEPVDLTVVAADVRDRLSETLSIADPVVERLFGREHRTAVRRLLVDAIIANPEILRRKGRTATLAAGGCLAIAQADQRLAPEGTLRAKTIADAFGLASAPTSRVDTLRQAVSRDRGWGTGHSLRSPRYLTGRRRAEIVEIRERLRAQGVDQPTPSPDQRDPGRLDPAQVQPEEIELAILGRAS